MIIWIRAFDYSTISSNSKSYLTMYLQDYWDYLNFIDIYGTPRYRLHEWVVTPTSRLVNEAYMQFRCYSYNETNNSYWTFVIGMSSKN